MPWTSSFTGETCQQMANDYEAAGGGQWNANLSNYSLFEVAHAAFMSVNNPHDKTEVADAIHNVNINALAGPLDFASSQESRPRRGDHPARRRAVAEGNQVPVGDEGRRQHAAAAGDDHRRPDADEHLTG